MQQQADNLALWLQKGLGRRNKRSDVQSSLQITQRNCNVVKETDSDDLNTASQASRHPQATFIDEKFKVRLIARRIPRQWEMEQLETLVDIALSVKALRLEANWNGEQRRSMPNERGSLVIKINREIFCNVTRSSFMPMKCRPRHSQPLSNSHFHFLITVEGRS